MRTRSAGIRGLVVMAMATLATLATLATVASALADGRGGPWPRS